MNEEEDRALKRRLIETQPEHEGMSAPSLGWRYEWANYGRGLTATPPLPGSDGTETVAIRNSAITTWLGELKRQIPNASQMEGSLRSGQEFLLSRNRPTKFRSMAEHTDALRQYQLVETTLRNEASNFCPHFGDDREAAKEFYFDNRKVSHQAAKLFSEIVAHVAKAPEVEAVAEPEQTPIQVLFRPAVDPNLPPSVVEAPPGDQLKIGDVLTKIGQANRKKVAKRAQEIR